MPRPSVGWGHVALLLAFVLTACTSDAPPSPPTSDSGSLTPAVPAAWRSVSPAPISTRVGHVAAWSGHELLIWGGESHPTFDPNEPLGAAYDPATDAWRALPEAPIQGRRGAVTAFTGTELLVMGGLGAGDQPLADGAAYSVETDGWRPLPASPLPGGAGLVGAWTGDEWILVNAGTAVDPEHSSGEAAAYDPSENTWRSLPPVPLPAGWASTAV